MDLTFAPGREKVSEVALLYRRTRVQGAFESRDHRLHPARTIIRVLEERTVDDGLHVRRKTRNACTESRGGVLQDGPCRHEIARCLKRHLAG